ncbi:TetR/AcrR family transcriptional regulator [Streptomyces cacaoi]|uniref:TetR family transcriptional regulator n=1 Tax=Streptomyces cacaoi TaxID=1898 RepID=A0A4Y3QYB1_STRCI|nr:TetR/AcrR family transcriptional regulator [Streptomyces cacaoi]NNG88609.1 TetR/AcrR family transcriptional regulator [Streptomyces cacaoi]GEB49583.1 TetR family transcriptional regulator [Streptomyces cacaoi]
MATEHTSEHTPAATTADGTTGGTAGGAAGGAANGAAGEAADGGGTGGVPRLVRSLDLLWGRTGKARPARGPKPGLTLQEIVRAAVELANSEGLAALSMRKVAARLGVGTMSLYRYVPGKGELLDLMVDHVQLPSEELAAHSGSDWRSTLELVAADSWKLYTDNPWLLQVNQARPLLGPNSLAGFEIAIKALDGVPLSGQEKTAALVALDNLVQGSARTLVLAHQAATESGISDEEFWRTQYPYLERAVVSGDYPWIAALPEDTFDADDHTLLQFGLSTLLDGLDRLITTRSSAPGPGSPSGSASGTASGPGTGA